MEIDKSEYGYEGEFEYTSKKAEMKKVKKGMVAPVLLTIIGLFGFFLMVKFCIIDMLNYGETIEGRSILFSLLFLLLVFVGIFGFNFSLEYDEKHFAYKKSKSADPVEVEFSDIERIQHYSYRTGKNKTNEYRVYLKSTGNPVTIPYKQIDNGASYKEFFTQILKTNSEVKFTELRSGLIGGKEEKEITFEQFV